MKGTYVIKHHKKTPTVFRWHMHPDWDTDDLAFPAGFASQSGVSPRGSSVVMGRMPSIQLGGLVPHS